MAERYGGHDGLGFRFLIRGGCEGWPAMECVRKIYSPHFVNLFKIGQNMKIYVDRNKIWLSKSVAVYTKWAGRD